MVIFSGKLEAEFVNESFEYFYLAVVAEVVDQFGALLRVENVLVDRELSFAVDEAGEREEGAFGDGITNVDLFVSNNQLIVFIARIRFRGLCAIV